MTPSAQSSKEHKTLSAAPLPRIKVLGLGGGGSNAINRMIELGLSGVDYIGANTDAQALKNCLAPTRIQLGPSLTRGLGAGGNPDIGEKAAEESDREITKALDGADMVFLTAGMGGGTGTGAIPVAARISRSLGAVTIGVVTTPFSFEIGKRQQNAAAGLTKLRQHTDTLITIPNDRLLKISPRDLPLELAFRLADDLLRQGIQGITELVTQPGMINVDFAHVRNMMKNGGGAILVVGYGQGENSALQAVKQALNHPLLDAIPLEQAAGIIANFSGSDDLAFVEIADALMYLHKNTNTDTDVIPGININPQFKDRVEAILVITGLEGKAVDHKMRGLQQEKLQPEFPPQMEKVVAVESENHTDFVFSESNLDIPSFIRRRIRA